MLVLMASIVLVIVIAVMLPNRKYEQYDLITLILEIMMKVKNIQSETAMEQHSELPVSNQFEPTCQFRALLSIGCLLLSSTAFGLAARSSGARMKRASGFTLY